MLTKADWRRRAREARAGMAFDDPRHCQELARFLADDQRPPGWVVGYRAMPGEVDLASLFARPELGPFALTRTPEEGRQLTVHPLGSPTERHPYGFDQPVADAMVVPDTAIAVVLVPGLAFDRQGSRLGRGRGYYDRFLARLAALSRPQAATGAAAAAAGAASSGPVVFVGVTGGYIVAELPTEPHDVPMTLLAGAFGVAPVPLPEPAG